MKFWKDNRVDQGYDLDESQIVSKFIDWLKADHRNMECYNGWPLDRTVGLFAMESLGTCDNYPELVYVILKDISQVDSAMQAPQ